MYRTWQVEKFKNLHTSYKHPSYYLERRLLSEIKRCHDDKAHQLLDQINAIERARLAECPLRSLKNSLIGTCVLFTRSAIEMNVNPEDAFSLSDLFIQQIESLNKIDELKALEYTMLHETIHLIRTERTSRYSLPVTQIIQFIHDHESEPITLEILTHHTHKTKEYLSSLFKKEVGMGITDFIQHERIHDAKNYLEFTDLCVAEIAFLLCFSSHSYFCKVFRKHVGCTPSQYRSDRVSYQVK